MSWLIWRRLRENRHGGFCPDCGHICDEHPGGRLAEPSQTTCGECGYEVDHGERSAGTECTAVAP